MTNELWVLQVLPTTKENLDLTAKDVAVLTRTSLGHTYKILGELEDMGLIVTYGSNPRSYCIISDGITYYKNQMGITA